METEFRFFQSNIHFGYECPVSTGKKHYLLTKIVKLYRIRNNIQRKICNNASFIQLFIIQAFWFGSSFFSGQNEHIDTRTKNSERNIGPEKIRCHTHTDKM